MVKEHHQRPELNAGSMADIAFLLLIFFLVSTQINEELGIVKKMPSKDEISAPMAERNVVRMDVNEMGQILFESRSTELESLKSMLVEHVMNDAGKPDQPRLTFKDPASPGLSSYSALAERTTVLLSYSPQTSYDRFLAVQNELRSAFVMLQERCFKQACGMNMENADQSNAAHLAMIDAAKAAFPIRIAEQLER